MCVGNSRQLIHGLGYDRPDACRIRSGSADSSLLFCYKFIVSLSIIVFVLHFPLRKVWMLTSHGEATGSCVSKCAIPNAEAGRRLSDNTVSLKCEMNRFPFCGRGGLILHDRLLLLHRPQLVAAILDSHCLTLPSSCSTVVGGE